MRERLRIRRRRCVRATVRAASVLVYSFCIAGLAVPLPLIARIAPAAAASGSSGELLETDVVFPRFVEEAAAMGLMPAAHAVVETAGITESGQQLTVATTSAAAPPDYATAPAFFRRLRVYQIVAADLGESTPIAENELIVGHRDGRVYIESIDRVAPQIDELTGQPTGLAGLVIHRHSEFDMVGFETMVETLTGVGAPDEDLRPVLLGQMLDAGEIAVSNYREAVTVTAPDGTEWTAPAEDFDLGASFDRLGIDAATSGGTGAIIDCFEDIGVTVTVLGALCLVAGAVVCAAACAASAGVACIPCISGASLACGLAAATGSLGYCLAKALFGVDPPPTATRTPTRTPTLTPTPNDPGDCNGDARVTVNELIVGVAIALGHTPLSECTPFDVDRDGRISIGELTRAIANALR